MDNHEGHQADAEAYAHAPDVHAAPEPSPAPRRKADHSPLRVITAAELINPSPEQQAAISVEIDNYFNTPLEMIPFAETGRKPHRFYRFYEDSIAERFPMDADIRDKVHTYGRTVFTALAVYVGVKRALLALALAAVWLAVVMGPAQAAHMGLGTALQVGAAILAMVAVYPLFAGINALIFLQYRIGLENRSYELSRQIIQRTRDLQNLYVTLRAQPDQEETRYQNDGAEWGRRSAFLVRLLMWAGQRMEFLERYVQVEMWRVRRERYWVNWVGGALVILVFGAWAAWLGLQPAPAHGAALFRTLQVLGGAVGALLAWSSYHFWKTPLNLARDKLGAESWVRYADLDLDNTVGDQVSRDKSRLVEYRNLNKGR